MGFQHIPKSEAREIQKKGGASGGHRFTKAEARLAGKKGGSAVHQNRQSDKAKKKQARRQAVRDAAQNGKAR